jgi:uncharacterized integral membrane protein
MKAKIIFLMILLVLFTIFVTQNTESTEVIVFFWPLVLPKIVLLIITLVIGGIAGLMAAALINKKEIEKEKELEQKRIKEEEKIKSGKIFEERSRDKINKDIVNKKEDYDDFNK